MLRLDFDNVKSNKGSSDTPVAWYTCRTYLGADGMPDKMIKEDLHQQSMNSYDV
jgi:hypothetical protein